jgi:hypothetical protein
VGLFTFEHESALFPIPGSRVDIPELKKTFYSSNFKRGVYISEHFCKPLVVALHRWYGSFALWKKSFKLVGFKE